jgi:hypothetical protein
VQSQLASIKVLDADDGGANASSDNIRKEAQGDREQ